MSVQVALLEHKVSNPPKKANRVQEVLGDGFATKRFVETFDSMFETSPNIAYLRSLVLEWAFRGALIGQVRDDSPVSHTLQKVEAAWMGRQRKVVLPDVDESERPPSPDRWAWVRLGNVAEVVGGVTKGRNLKGREVRAYPYLRVANVQRGYVDLREMKTIEIPEEEIEKYRLVPGDILFTEGGDWDKLGRSCIWRGEIEPCIHQNHVFRARVLTPALDPGWFSLFANSPIGRRYFESAAKQTTNLASINMTQLRNCPIPLPPPKEKQLIVAKVDQLMALCDEFEARQTKKRESGTRLTKSALEALTSAEGPEFDVAWKRVVENFDVLIDKAEKVGVLRAAILQLAVTGKLVGHEVGGAAHEPTSSTPGIGDETRIKLPAAWRWVKLGQVGELINGDRSKSYPNRAEYVQEGVAWINTGHIEPDGTLSLASMHYISRKKFDSLRSGKVRPGDLVYCLRGATLGKTAMITQFTEGAVASSLVIIRLSPIVDPAFAYRVLTSPLGREQIFRFDNGSAQPNLSANSVKKYLIPLPPIDEQRRIVAKIEQLMKVCDALESRLRESEDRAAKLVEAVVQELVA